MCVSSVCTIKVLKCKELQDEEMAESDGDSMQQTRVWEGDSVQGQKPLDYF